MVSMKIFRTFFPALRENAERATRPIALACVRRSRMRGGVDCAVDLGGRQGALYRTDNPS